VEARRLPFNGKLFQKAISSTQSTNAVNYFKNVVHGVYSCRPQLQLVKTEYPLGYIPTGFSNLLDRILALLFPTSLPIPTLQLSKHCAEIGSGEKKAPSHYQFRYLSTFILYIMDCSCG